MELQALHGMATVSIPATNVLSWILWYQIINHGWIVPLNGTTLKKRDNEVRYCRGTLTDTVRYCCCSERPVHSVQWDGCIPEHNTYCFCSLKRRTYSPFNNALRHSSHWKSHFMSWSIRTWLAHMPRANSDFVLEFSCQAPDRLDDLLERTGGFNVSGEMFPQVHDVDWN